MTCTFDLTGNTFTQFVVCIDIQLNITIKTNHRNAALINKLTVRWSLGACSSLNSSEYQFPALYIHRCCLQPGRHILSCYNDPPGHGWKNAYLTIDGHRFCDNFVGFTSYQTLEITGTDLKQLSCLELYI